MDQMRRDAVMSRFLLSNPETLDHFCGGRQWPAHGQVVGLGDIDCVFINQEASAVLEYVDFPMQFSICLEELFDALLSSIGQK